MKLLRNLLFFSMFISLIFVSCDKEEDVKPLKRM